MTEGPSSISVTIDGEQIRVAPGTLLIRAAEQLGTIIPRFCDHPLLDPVGACRQCAVEVEDSPKPMMACTTPARDGMVVSTQQTSALARDAQESALEFLLINHPLDCPMCDKGGECPLQDQALAHGPGLSRFVDQKRRYDKPVAISPQILLDRERCVLCARCTRFADQIPGHPFIELFERGALEQVAIYEDEPYSSYFSGNIIQICPVGALTSTEYRFRARPFDAHSSPSVCDHCSAGCNLTVQSRRGEIQRQLARTNMEVNEAWTCDRGRFGFHHLSAGTRLSSPQLRDGDGELTDVSWPRALGRASEVLSGGLSEGSSGGGGQARTAVLTGSRLADEDAYAASRYARSVLGTDHIDHRTDFGGAAQTDALVAADGRWEATYADVEQAPTIVVAGLDPEEEVPILFLRIRKAWRTHQARVVPVGARMGSLAGQAWRWLATPPGGEDAALAALARALEDPDGSGSEQAVLDSVRGSGPDALAAVAERLRAQPGAVLLVGERAPAGALQAAHRIAEASEATAAFVARRAGAAGARRAGLAAGRLPGGRRLEDPDDRAAVEAVWGSLPAERGLDLRGVLRAAADGALDALHLIGVDLARDCRDPGLARAALERATVVVQDLAANATTAYAEVVLPAAATQEREGTITDWEGRAQPFLPAVPAPGTARADWEILVQLSFRIGETQGRMGRELGFDDLGELRAERDRLGAREPPHGWPQPTGETTDTATVDSADAADRGLRILTYPLLLDDATMLAGADNLRAAAPDPWVALHPDEAVRRGLATGDRVVLRGEGGQVTLPLRVEEGLVPGVVFAPAASTSPTVREVAAGAQHVQLEGV